MKKTKVLAIIALLLILVVVLFVLYYTKEGNAMIATNFVKNDATYKSDGIPETFNLTGVTATCPYCWEFTFEFQTSNNSVITGHTAKILMEKGTILSATLDNELKVQTPVEPESTPVYTPVSTPAGPRQRR